MIEAPGYKKAFIIAIAMHIFLAFGLMMDPSTNKRPVLTPEANNQSGQLRPLELSDKPKPEVLKAVSVDNKKIMEAVNKLKNERAQKLKSEQARQQALAKQVEQARRERLMEQQKLAKLKEEAAKVAIARKKQIEEEKKHLKELTLKKEKEAKQLKALQEQQKLEKKHQQELAKAQQAEQQRAEQQKAEQQRQQDAVQEASRQAKISGEVNKYKAMILNAISQKWIVPENANSNLSSQFRIRLAPDGAVLDVNLTRGSGDSILDRSAQTAIYKASPLPVPSDPDTFSLFRDISLTVRPENIRG
jgi:colicin import membrane protein